MKNTLKLVIAIALVACMALALVACPQPVTASQGIDAENHVIHVGNTAATTGAFAPVGVPFNYAQEAYFWYFTTQTEGYKDAEGNKYTIEFHHYDDGFDGTKGMTYTKKLVEEDKVFALVGHFGSNTVGATVDYLSENGIPMVYGVCGVSDLYDTERNIMTVQPIYDTEGQSMLATAFASVEVGGLAASKVGVIATTDEAGKGMLNGIKIEAERLGKTYELQEVAADATDYTAAVTALKNAGCDVVIIAANQAPFTNIANTFVTAQYDNVDIITSYVSANYAAMGALVLSGAINQTREIYAGAWLVTGSAPDTSFKGWNDFAEFARIMTLYATHKGEELVKLEDDAVAAALFSSYEWAQNGISSNYLNSYAMAGYVSANVFCQGLERMNGKTLTWDAFIDAMEEGPINVPMGTNVSYVGGQRVGIDALALNKYTVANFGVGEVYRGITGLATLEDSIK